MLIEDFDKWRSRNKVSYLPSKEVQEIFYDFYDNTTEDKDVFNIVKRLAYEIYELQVCVEGLIEDGEI